MIGHADNDDDDRQTVAAILHGTLVWGEAAGVGMGHPSPPRGTTDRKNEFSLEMACFDEF